MGFEAAEAVLMKRRRKVAMACSGRFRGGEERVEVAEGGKGVA